MKSRFKQLIEDCGDLSRSEYLSTADGKWPLDQSIPDKWKVPYTFNVTHIQTALQNEADFILPSLINFSPLTSQTQKSVIQALRKWEKACGNNIEFIYQSHFPKHAKGIQFAFSRHLDAYAQTSLLIQNGEKYLPKITNALISLPPDESDAFFLHSIAHEVGHSLGLVHLHDIPSVLSRLQTSPQGQGCSVMPYQFIVSTYKNNCTTPNICLNTSYAINPGPLDTKICQNLYNPTHSTFQHIKQVQTDAQFYTSYGVYYGGLEQGTLTFLKNLRHQGMPLITKPLAVAISKCVSTPFQNTLKIVGIPMSLIFLPTELACEYYDLNIGEYIKYGRLGGNLFYTLLMLTRDANDGWVFTLSDFANLIFMSLLLSFFCSKTGELAANGINLLLDKYKPFKHSPMSPVSFFNQTDTSTSNRLRTQNDDEIPPLPLESKKNV